MKTLRPGKTVDVNKLVELVKVEANDILMVKQSCTVLLVPLSILQSVRLLISTVLVTTTLESISATLYAPLTAL